MFEKHVVEIEWGGRPLTLETGQVARQADGSVLVTYGETTVMCNVVSEKQPKPHLDFFPLTVNYIEKAYSAGKIPGGFFKREARPSENETLVCRLIDRPIRPLFAEGYKNDTQVTCTVMSHDMENNPDIVAMIATSAALTISGVPFQGPIGGARVGLIDGEYVLNPNVDEMPESDLDLIVAGTNDAVLMVESEANVLSEEQMLGAVMFGHEEFQPVIDAIIKLAEKAAKPAREHTVPDNSDLEGKLTKLIGKDIEKAYKIADKQDRYTAIDEAKAKAKEKFLTEESTDAEKTTFSGVFKQVQANVVRGSIIKTKKRIDGRDLDTVRAIESEVGILPRTHGSALFTRGETQAIVVATLGTSDDEQFIDALTGTYKENFLLHYNFPPYSVGETGRIGFTSRREIGHGKLAWRAVKAVLPSKDEFPYTLRAVSEITESNGSSSMATVCGTSLAFMDAGVPLKAPVAGIAMGLIKEGDDFAVLSDILGDEDHLGHFEVHVAEV
ncbi:MAG: polyribonucleotide nucleotidyltransferase, partial [Pseudomonadota bacterium]